MFVTGLMVVRIADLFGYWGGGILLGLDGRDGQLDLEDMDSVAFSWSQITHVLKLEVTGSSGIFLGSKWRLLV